MKWHSFSFTCWWCWCVVQFVLCFICHQYVRCHSLFVHHISVCFILASLNMSFSVGSMHFDTIQGCRRHPHNRSCKHTYTYEQEKAFAVPSREHWNVEHWKMLCRSRGNIVFHELKLRSLSNMFHITNSVKWHCVLMAFWSLNFHVEMFSIKQTMKRNRNEI